MSVVNTMLITMASWVLPKLNDISLLQDPEPAAKAAAAYPTGQPESTGEPE